MNNWVHDSPIKNIALKAIMIMPSLLLQKPSKSSKAKDHILSLERRMELWHNGHVSELFHESETIQKCLKSPNKKSTIAQISKKFAEHM